MKSAGSSDNAISVKGLRKSFKDVKVLKGINFDVPRGTIMALLGPNGAGKTTTIRILSTLLSPDAGEAHIAGLNVVEQPTEVKAVIGLTGQYAAVDEYLNGEENLLMMGRLYRLSKKDTKERAQKLIKLFDLTSAAQRPVKTYSGGMKRRIDLAMSMIASPPVIFLDEPTTGLDPRSRLSMWDSIKSLAKSGTTILLTTQYMDEADNLADNIVVIDEGKVIAEGTVDQLKKRLGGERLELTISRKSDFSAAANLFKGRKARSDTNMRTISMAVTGGAKQIKNSMDLLEGKGIDVEGVSLHKPTLDDVFLQLTGRQASVAKVKPKKSKGKK